MQTLEWNLKNWITVMAMVAIASASEASMMKKRRAGRPPMVRPAMTFTVPELCMIIAAFELADDDQAVIEEHKFFRATQKRFMQQLRIQDEKTCEVMCRIFS